MKKLNLQLGSIKEMLTKEQMKKVAGGYTGCTADCWDGSRINYDGGDCDFLDVYTETTYTLCIVVFAHPEQGVCCPSKPL